MIEHAALRIAGDFPFHAALLSRLVVTPSDSTHSLGVRVEALAFHLLYNPDFIIELSADECEALLLHVLNHLVFGHITMDHAAFPDGAALVTAMEITANEWVGDRPLPPGAITLEQFPTLPPSEDTVTRYHRLVEMGVDSPDTVDDHLEAGEGGEEDEETEQAPGVSRDLVRSLLRADALAALDQLDETQKKSIPEPVREVLRELVTIAGLGSADGRVDVTERQAVMNWRVALRQLLPSLDERQPSYSRPSRRAPSLVGIVPGTARAPGKLTLVVAIDTSASMTVRQLNMIAGELSAIGDRAEATVIECDCQITDMYKFAGRLNELKGRGGTDLRPPFSASLALRPDALVYFTDGFGTAPQTPPPFPAIWCLTANGQRPAPWGRVLWMPTLSSLAR
jgi:predicted metal-dependent peptidase